MTWKVDLHDDFVPEYHALTDAVQDSLLAHIALLKQFGPMLGRPYADTLKGSRHGNMKELRFYADGGVWRVVFAFDPNRNAILLIAGDKAGVSEVKFYRRLIDKADTRFETHLTKINNDPKGRRRS